ncbi:hypothetical protein SDC9_125864 [bioreactor metagenome]|uniref:Uncharacterized protein n=1 Tax=bioreactor metagenome TaxID=1076179 RepID=A0A645CPL7_9ZZZZ
MFPNINKPNPNIKEVIKPEEPKISASSLFCWPSFLEIVLPEPKPMAKAMACIIAIRENTMPVAAEALVPS